MRALGPARRLAGQIDVRLASGMGKLGENDSVRLMNNLHHFGQAGNQAVPVQSKLAISGHARAMHIDVPGDNGPHAPGRKIAAQGHLGGGAPAVGIGLSVIDGGADDTVLEAHGTYESRTPETVRDGMHRPFSLKVR